MGRRWAVLTKEKSLKPEDSAITLSAIQYSRVVDCLKWSFKETEPEGNMNIKSFYKHKSVADFVMVQAHSVLPCWRHSEEPARRQSLKSKIRHGTRRIKSASTLVYWRKLNKKNLPREKTQRGMIPRLQQ